MGIRQSVSKHSPLFLEQHFSIAVVHLELARDSNEAIETVFLCRLR